MGEQAPQVESRGGDKPDWGSVVAGEPLPEQGEEYPEPGSQDAPQEGRQLQAQDSRGELP